LFGVCNERKYFRRIEGVRLEKYDEKEWHSNDEICFKHHVFRDRSTENSETINTISDHSADLSLLNKRR
jgi:hypothetical protein